MFNKTKKILSDSCIIFTIFVIVLLCVYSAISNPDDGIVSGLSLETSLIVFISSILLRTFFEILFLENFSFISRIIFHYILTTATSFGALTLIREVTNTSLKQSPVAAFIILSVLSLIYILACAIFIIFNHRRKERSKEKNSYSSIVKK